MHIWNCWLNLLSSQAEMQIPRRGTKSRVKLFLGKMRDCERVKTGAPAVGTEFSECLINTFQLGLRRHIFFILVFSFFLRIYLLSGPAGHIAL